MEHTSSPDLNQCGAHIPLSDETSSGGALGSVQLPAVRFVVSLGKMILQVK